MGLNRPLKAGNKLQLGLRFEKSGEKPIDVPIAPASGPEGH
jgi:copper(I)-binding protein